ncbi:hypothetical protein Kpol_1048p27 [Vanderwaltozyma polyspora DSM 70294]|uniref:Arginase n=1 Tax=Vanderwaltozyma polyspora (strain ATCC 22028 / DSM 70294 / BCRC 21397 / CBS 2163 / NBRC 10782 / NRRL Y-8283 / UCD 57-17) TaxID=436907 RepID=A7TGJ0_VANPO|nr:uncharacterized protein Kpol_1048p27 [Vanderwaltozyma polyspora DSM 70294]EDO18597.1 hypothetical protein Kpol_1048p27 [Vanderwaltozyma polyspora DSM 70294]
MEAPHYKFLNERKVSLVLAPFSGGQKKQGVEKGPQYMLKHGLESNLNELGWETKLLDPLQGLDVELQDDSDDIKGSNIKNSKSVGVATQLIHNSVKETLNDNRFPLTLGGDHSIAMGTVSAVVEKYPNAGVLWIDAHADINTVDSTESGNLHGCPVSFLMGLNPEEKIPSSLKWLPKNLKPNKIAYIGLRDLDDAEKKILKDLNISAFSMYHVDRYGINKVIEMAIESISTSENDPIMCSYDVDAVDPLYVPATGTPVRGGLTLREGLFIVERLAETGRLVALDVVECNPDLSHNDIHVVDTISAGCAIARCALGETLL